MDKKKLYNKYYYLLYRLRNNTTFWIVDESIYKNELIQEIKNFYSNKEVYYIFSKIYPIEYIEKKLDTKFVRFKIFTIDNKCKLEYKTE
jgi:hypothetical protein